MGQGKKARVRESPMYEVLLKRKGRLTSVGVGKKHGCGGGGGPLGKVSKRILRKN